MGGVTHRLIYMLKSLILINVGQISLLYSNIKSQPEKYYIHTKDNLLNSMTFKRCNLFLSWLSINDYKTLVFSALNKSDVGI